ncbi:alkaline phosphatase, partial [Xanthomonas perforans]|nr:alkaline phosphatase [Xanthomonas perforans]
MPMRYRLPTLAALTTLCVAACASTTGSSTSAPASVRVEVPPVAHPAGETPQWWYRSGAARAAGNGAMAG